MKKIKLFLLVFLGTLIGAMSASAQKTIKGTISDAEGKEPLVGASVTVKGTTKGVVSDVNGQYSLDVPADAKTLVFSFVGYTSKEATIGDSQCKKADHTGPTHASIVFLRYAISRYQAAAIVQALRSS